LDLIGALPDNRYSAIEYIRKKLDFSESEWRCLLRALARTDNGWFQFMLDGDLTIDFKKFVDIGELQILIEKKMKHGAVKSLKYVYDLSDFWRP
jgi:hypothetical protein